MPNDSILEGFEIVPSDSVPYITLDNQRRFYLNASARRLMDVKPYERLALAYNSIDRAIAVLRPNENGEDYALSNYNVDKRYYMSARHFSKQYGYDSDKAPYTFVYDRGASDGSAFIFRLVGGDERD